MSKSNLIKSGGIIGIATAASRVLGFVRDIVIANLFGTAMYAQAFVVAFRIPNLLRDLIGEGATNSALVPVLTEELTKKGRGDFFRLAQVVFNILTAVLITLTVIGVMASPVIVKLIAPGFLDDPEKFEVTVNLTRLLFPFLLLVGLWAYAMAVLNSLGHFTWPAFGPAILNMAIIICAKYFGENVFGLASGVLIGGILQMSVQAAPLARLGWHPKLTGEFRHPEARKIGVLLIPRAIGACAYQVNVFVGTILASLSGIVGEGAVAALYYANRVWQLPLAIFGIALAQAALPMMSRHAASNEMDKLKEMTAFSLKAVFFVLIPATVGLAVLSRPITKVLFERGAFTGYSTEITSCALLFYTLGLAASGGIKVLVSTFYSLHDTRTPVKTAFAALAINLALNIVLMYPLKAGGLALATSISAIVNFLVLYQLLRKRLGGLDTKAISNSLIKVGAASAIMAVFLIGLSSFFSPYSVIKLLITIIMAILSFIAASRLLKVRELEEFLAWIQAKR